MVTFKQTKKKKKKPSGEDITGRTAAPLKKGQIKDAPAVLAGRGGTTRKTTGRGVEVTTAGKTLKLGEGQNLKTIKTGRGQLSQIIGTGKTGRDTPEKLLADERTQDRLLLEKEKADRSRVKSEIATAEGEIKRDEQIKEQEDKITEEKKLFDFRKGFKDIAKVLAFKGSETIRPDDSKFSKTLKKVANTLVNSIEVTGGVALVTLNLRAAAIATGAVLGADTLGTWFAADNIASSIPFQLNSITDAAERGLISRGEASDLINQAQNTLDFTSEAIDTSTRLNPALWAARKRYVKGIEVVQRQFDLKRLLIEGGNI